MAVEQTSLSLNTIDSTPIVSVGAGDAPRIVISLYISLSEAGFVTLTSGTNFIMKDLPVADVYVSTGKILVNPGDSLEIRILGLDSDTGRIWENMSEDDWFSMSGNDWFLMGVFAINSTIYTVHSDI